MLQIFRRRTAGPPREEDRTLPLQARPSRPGAACSMWSPPYYYRSVTTTRLIRPIFNPIRYAISLPHPRENCNAAQISVILREPRRAVRLPSLFLRPHGLTLPSQEFLARLLRLQIALPIPLIARLALQSLEVVANGVANESR